MLLLLLLRLRDGCEGLRSRLALCLFLYLLSFGFFLLFFLSLPFGSVLSLLSLKHGVFGYLGRNITTNKGYDMGGKKSFHFLFCFVFDGTGWRISMGSGPQSKQEESSATVMMDGGLEVSAPLSLDPSVHQGEISEERAFVSGELRFLA